MSDFTKFYDLKFLSELCPPTIEEIERPLDVTCLPPNHCEYVGQLSILCKIGNTGGEMIYVAMTQEQLESLKQQLDDYLAKIK